MEVWSRTRSSRSQAKCLRTTTTFPPCRVSRRAHAHPYPTDLSLTSPFCSLFVLAPTDPFFGYRNGSSNIATIRNVSLVDGGEDNENIPLWSLLQPARGLDFIFATDGSADISNWPNGSSLYQTSERAKNPQFSDVPFPDMPSTEVSQP